VKSKELKEMVFQSIKKLGSSTKKEYLEDVIDTAMKQGLVTKEFIMQISSIGFAAQNLKREGRIVIDNSNDCECGKCAAGSIHGLNTKTFYWSIA
tara:strand:+ start:264 stop:548 length:285 start_codon:yes stop_codon:yes gene_type:complete